MRQGSRPRATIARSMSLCRELQRRPISRFFRIKYLQSLIIGAALFVALLNLLNAQRAHPECQTSGSQQAVPSTTTASVNNPSTVLAHTADLNLSNGQVRQAACSPGSDEGTEEATSEPRRPCAEVPIHLREVVGRICTPRFYGYNDGMNTPNETHSMQPNLQQFRADFIENFSRIPWNSTPGDAHFLRILIESSRAKKRFGDRRGDRVWGHRDGAGVRAKRRPLDERRSRHRDGQWRPEGTSARCSCRTLLRWSRVRV